MLRPGLTVAALLLATGAALAQAPAGPSSPTATPAEPTPLGSTRPAATPSETARPAGPMRHGSGSAWIRVRAPNGAEIAVRCADGDSTRTCGDIVESLADKLMRRPEHRREAGGEMSRDMPRDYEQREPDMGRDDRRDRYRGEDRPRGSYQ